ncbi:MAG: hypothetical protein QMD00_00830 [Hadesarchaea archaeon]|nr:hypothetical protein [Hadesarchaea archaeon]
MSRKSLAELVYENVEEDDPRPSMLKLVIYDFDGNRIPRKFYFNLRELLKLAGDGFAIQYSVILTEGMKAARAVKELAQTCWCKKVRIYAVEELEF